MIAYLFALGWALRPFFTEHLFRFGLLSAAAALACGAGVPISVVDAAVALPDVTAVSAGCEDPAAIISARFGTMQDTRSTIELRSLLFSAWLLVSVLLTHSLSWIVSLVMCHQQFYNTLKLLLPTVKLRPTSTVMCYHLFWNSAWKWSESIPWNDVFTDLLVVDWYWSVADQLLHEHDIISFLLNDPMMKSNKTPSKWSVWDGLQSLRDR